MCLSVLCLVFATAMIIGANSTASHVTLAVSLVAFSLFYKSFGIIINFRTLKLVCLGVGVGIFIALFRPLAFVKYNYIIFGFGLVLSIFNFGANKYFSKKGFKILLGSYLFIILACLIFTLTWMNSKTLAEVKTLYVENIELLDASLAITTNKGSVSIENSHGLLEYFVDDVKFELVIDGDKLQFGNSTLNELVVNIGSQDDVTILSLKKSYFGFFKDGNVKYLGVNEMVSQIDYPESFPSSRHIENFGSGRMYIWSRTIPMLKDSLIFGSGADTFLPRFPQNDLVGKINFTDPYLLVDKPHNWYLQMAVFNGLAYMILNILIISITIIRCYKSKISKQLQLPFVLAILNFAIIGFFNDSYIQTTPIYYCILGLLWKIQNDEIKENN